MNIIEIRDGLTDGTIKLDTKGHITNPVLNSLNRHVNNDLDWIKKLEKGTYTDTDKKKWSKKECDDFSSYLKVKLYKDYTSGQFIHETEHYCFDCGESLHLIVIDDHTVSFLDSGKWCELRMKDENGKTFVDPSNIPDCATKSLRDLGKLVSEINVPSGELLFRNNFQTDEIYTMPDEYKSENSICSISGRFNLMKYLATKNIGYGQMGNMSVNVFLNKAGDEIIIGTDHDYDGNREYTVKHKGFNNLGSISLSVWRWMCGDLQVLREHGEPIPDNLKVNTQTDDDYADCILTKVQPGTWVIEHYYDFCKRKDIIYSKLYLKK